MVIKDVDEFSLILVTIGWQHEETFNRLAEPSGCGAGAVADTSTSWYVPAAGWPMCVVRDLQCVRGYRHTARACGVCSDECVRVAH